VTSAQLHADALTTLASWTPPSRRQRALRERYVAHLEAHQDGLSRDCHPDHVTASTLVLSADRTQALLTLHAKAQRWFQFGGHCERDDLTLAGAALREATEESGIAGLSLDPVPLRLDEHVVPFCGSRGGVHHLDVWFLATAPAAAQGVVSPESIDVRWWPLDGLPEDTSAWAETLAILAVAQPSSTGSSGEA
jgi:8-oxo-dGTP pyrophosphatase MutT (NUDIX family)